MNRRKLILLAFGAPTLSHGQHLPDVDRSIGNLMVVLRESIRAKPRPDESLEFIGHVKFKVDDGKEIEAELAHYAYLGDMHLRFVFDGPNTMTNASPSDLSRLGLTPDKALDVAVENIRRAYGPPRSEPFGNGLMEVDGKSPDLISSYFLDKSFWNELERANPQGIVAVVPKRGGLLYTPVANLPAVELLKRNVAYLHGSSERLRVSSGVYFYKDGKWSILQAPAPARHDA